MTRFVFVLVLAQLNLNTAPIIVKDEGVKQQSYSASTIDCVGAGITCTQSSKTMTVTVPGGGAGGSSYDGGKVGEAYAADASITAQAFDHDPSACGATQYVTDISASGALTCSTPAGSGSGPNVGRFYVYFGDGTRATPQSLTATVTAAWATATSSIVMSPACWVTDGGVTSDECRIVQPECSVLSVTASTSFTVGCTSEVGGFGNYTMSYVGL